MGSKLSDPAVGAEYRRALDYLFARTQGGMKFGLERTEALLAHLGQPQRRYPCFHVAGTNGKGSTVATLTALLSAGGRRVAAYTSPHLVDFRERVVVAGSPMPEADVVDWVARHAGIIEELGATFFEATTAMAFDYFARASADVAVIEVGLGGRLDSTNVVDPIVAGVTSIGVDHAEYLGDTVEQIAMEKAGIFKQGRPAVVGERDARIAGILVGAAAAAAASPVIQVREAVPLHDVRVVAGGTQLRLTRAGETVELRTPLAGEHQAQNLATAVAMFDAAGPEYALDAAAMASAIAGVRLPGRFQRSGKWIFDVAHNPDGARVLAETLAAVGPRRPLVAMVGVLSDKDWLGMLRIIAPVVDRVILTTPPTAPASRIWDLDAARERAAALSDNVDAIGDFDAALDRADSLGATVLVTGSFHTVGDAMLRLQVSPMAG